MKEFKGTKKNWLLNDTDNEIFGGQDNYNQITAGNGVYNQNGNIQSGFCLSGYISKENAQIIVCAPELLENLIRCVERLEENGYGNFSAVERAKQAINKALS